MDFFSTAWSWFTGSSISAALGRTALVGYVAKLLAGNTGNPQDTPTPPDPGVRIQLNPSTDNQIPVLYGEAYFGGNIIDAQLSSDYKKMTYALAIAETTGTKLSNSGATGYTFKGCYFNNNRVIFKSDGVTVDYTVDASGNQDISARDLVKVYFYGHNPLQPEGFSGTTPAAYTVMPGWDSTNYSMNNLIYAVVEVTYSKDKGITGLPDITWHIDSDMKKPGDVIYDYMTNVRYGAGITSGEINSSALTALNTFCDTGFTYTNKLGQSVTSSITINGLVDTTQSVFSNIEELAKACSSWVSYDTHQGQWTIIINKAGSSTASFTDSNIIGEITISGTSLIQLNNIVNVQYQNTDILDKTDFVKIALPSGSLHANEQPSTLDVNLPFTNKQAVAAKIGLQALKQARVDKVITFHADYSFFNLKAGDLIDVTNSVYGFTSKVFRIVTITEIDGDDGTIQFEIKALEYDASVYSYDITEYSVTTNAGIIGVGSIGKPNTPTVTKTEEANVPKIVINSVVPSGIVDTMEFWITFDTGVSNDAARTYIKIGQYSNPDASLLAQNATASYTYTGLQQSDFYIKVRGINNVTVGPFSNPSGLITYKPVVIADTVSDTPVSVGGQLMSLGLLTLINNLDKLFKGDSSPGGLFDKIMSVFEQKTGVDLVGQAAGGSFAVDLTVRDEGNTVSTATSVLNFVGDGVVATADGSNVTVTIGGSGGTGGGGTGGTGQCYITPTDYYPKQRGSTSNSVPGVESDPWGPNMAPTKGSYYLRYGGLTGNLVKGTGTAKLYKTDGTLVSTVSASSATVSGDVVEIPFSTRDTGTDYYVLLSEGFVTNNGCLSNAITDPEGWYFNTPLQATYATSVNGSSQTTPSYCGTPMGIGLWLEPGTSGQSSNSARTNINRQSWIGIEFNKQIKLTKSGTIVIGGLETINIGETFVTNKVAPRVWVGGTILWINPTKDMAAGGSYVVTVGANVVSDLCGTAGNPEITSDSWVCADGPHLAVAPMPASGSINENGVVMSSSLELSPGQGSAYIYDSNGTLISTIASNSSAVTFTPT